MGFAALFEDLMGRDRDRPTQRCAVAPAQLSQHRPLDRPGFLCVLSSRDFVVLNADGSPLFVGDHGGDDCSEDQSLHAHSGSRNRRNRGYN